MYCPKCGQPVPEGTRFCGACGSMLEEPVTMDTGESVLEEEIAISESAGQPVALKPRKNNVLPILLIAAIVIVIVAVNVIIAMMPTAEERWQEQYDLGQQYLLELDYEQAIVAFTAAIEIDENDSSAWIGRAQSYYGLGVQEMETTAGMDGEDGLSKTAQEYMSSALSDYDKALTLGDTQPDIYIGKADVYVALGDYEEAVSILETGIQENPEDTTISERLSEVTMALQMQVLQQEHWDTVMNLISAVLEDPLSIGGDDWYGDAFDSFLSGLDSVIFCELESGWYLGVYPSGSIYYGEMENGQRSGEGYWIHAVGCSQESLDSLEDNSYLALCTNRIYYGKWAEDYPNGWGQYTEYYVDNTGELHHIETVEINFTNGCPDGTGTFTYVTAEWSGSGEIQAVNGYFVPLYEEADGYVYASIDGSDGRPHNFWSTLDYRMHFVLGAYTIS